jgi:monoamine oxidase
MPLTIVAGLQTDFSRETQASIAAVRYATAGKMGLQFKRRFWEEDDNIYGGASKTDQPIGEIYYPSTGFHGQKGVLLGYYVRGQNSLTFGDLSPAERIATALEQGSRIHPQYHKEFEAGFSVAWHRMPWIKGSWSAFGGNTREQLRRGDGRVYFAGDHMSTMNAWMQGAFQSARDVVMTIHARAVPEGRSA